MIKQKEDPLQWRQLEYLSKHRLQLVPGMNSAFKDNFCKLLADSYPPLAQLGLTHLTQFPACGKDTKDTQ